MRRLASTLLALLPLLFTATLLAASAHGDEAGDKPATKKDAPLAGVYRFEGGQKNGGEAASEDLKQAKVSITATEIVATDKDDNRTYMATYTLDTAQKPWRIRMESILPAVGAKADGLVEMQDDGIVRIIYALPGGEMPTEFKTKEKQHMWVLKAERKDGRPAEKAEDKESAK